jgi:hypothetical protein
VLKLESKLIRKLNGYSLPELDGIAYQKKQSNKLKNAIACGTILEK